MSKQRQPQPPAEYVDPALERMARANAKPIDVGMLAPDAWQHVGGDVGFTWNGLEIRGNKK